MIRILMLACFSIPGISWLILSLPARWSERSVALFSRTATLLYGICVGALLFAWILKGGSPRQEMIGTLFSHGSYEFPLVFYFDVASAAFISMTAFLVFLILTYSQYYMHREEGFRRFFALLLLFLFGMTCLSLSGTIDLLFAGWEIVGVSSFLLIGFYYAREQPVRNAIRTYSVYRICDVGLLLGAWLSHRLLHENQFFGTLSSMSHSQLLVHMNQTSLVGLSILIVLAACGKSAQFPFSFWLSRAMEGPTPSSAIFYGALSVHAGVFLLYRTYFLWHSHWIGIALVVSVGLITAAIATLSGRIQSNIKGQIAYASAAQVGLQFVELGLGFPNLALLHFIGNACFRCYQLLVSPSVVTYLVRLQSSADAKLKTSDWSFERLLPPRLRSSLYVLAFNEGYMERFFRDVLLLPAIALGKRLVRAPLRGYEAGLLVAIVLCSVVREDGILRNIAVGVAIGAAFRELVMALVWERKPERVLSAACRALVFCSIPVCALVPAAMFETLLYMAILLVAWTLGTWGLSHGSWAGTLIAFVTLTGFPLAPTFLGEDVMLNFIAKDHLWIAAYFTVVHAVSGIALARAMFRHAHPVQASGILTRS